VFTNSRYPYESSRWKFSDPVPVKFWIGYYKEQRTQDPFALDYIAEVQTRAAALGNNWLYIAP